MAPFAKMLTYQLKLYYLNLKNAIKYIKNPDDFSIVFSHLLAHFNASPSPENRFPTELFLDFLLAGVCTSDKFSANFSSFLSSPVPLLTTGDVRKNHRSDNSQSLNDTRSNRFSSKSSVDRFRPVVNSIGPGWRNACCRPLGMNS